MLVRVRNLSQPTLTTFFWKLFSTKCKWFGKLRDTICYIYKYLKLYKRDLYFAVNNGPSYMRDAVIFSGAMK